MQHFMLLLLKSVGLFSKKVFGVRAKLMGTAYYGVLSMKLEFIQP